MNLLPALQSGWMPLVIFAVAAVYSAIGQGGGTGYLAVMASGGLSPGQIRPTALALNIMVSGLAGWKFFRAGRFQPSVFWPAIATGAPAAMLGAAITLPAAVYQVMVACVLFYAAERLFRSSGLTKQQHQTDVVVVNPLQVSACGAMIGLISGLTGIGGGIFLSPLMILARWADAKNAAGTSALYTLVNSVVGLAVVSSKFGSLSADVWLWLVAAGLGAWLGSEFALKGLSERAARRLLAFALTAAACRSLWSVIF